MLKKFEKGKNLKNLPGSITMPLITDKPVLDGCRCDQADFLSGKYKFEILKFLELTYWSDTEQNEHENWIDQLEQHPRYFVHASLLLKLIAKYADWNERRYRPRNEILLFFISLREIKERENGLFPFPTLLRTHNCSWKWVVQWVVYSFIISVLIEYSNLNLNSSSKEVYWVVGLSWIILKSTSLS